MQETSETTSGSVRVDLLGGTIDLDPINHILEATVTLNMATNLKAKVILEKKDENFIEINSLDYDDVTKVKNDHLNSSSDDQLINDYHHIAFVLLIVKYFKPKTGVSLQLSSGSPAGAGLGGSSAMGVTLFKALAKHFQVEEKYSKTNVISIVKNIEAKILNQGVTGYQDYYPALYGGILALKPSYDSIEVEQLYTEELRIYLKSHLRLIYSGISRNSGINNWEVYKSFFDGNSETRSGLKDISQLSHQAHQAIKDANYGELLSLVCEEGRIRENLFSNIVPEAIQDFITQSKQKFSQVIGAKMCGAGGGGCFLIILNKPFSDEQENTFLHLINSFNMKKLELDISKPCG
ncbi:hypothetical protein N9N67_01840 [Bacteriovoracaceae bacterium]|nr:hypothetical protein [Bacteriovoracaceae bacterium]